MMLVTCSLAAAAEQPGSKRTVTAPAIEIKWMKNIPGEVTVETPTGWIHQTEQNGAVSCPSGSRVWLKLNHIISSPKTIVPSTGIDAIYGIDFDYCELSNWTISQLQKFPQLRALRLSHTTASTAELEAINKIGSLESLNLSNTRAADRDMNSLPAKLKTLHLDYCNISDRACAVLATHPGITSLSLAGTKISDKGISDLAKNNALSSLDLAYCDLTDRSVDSLLRLTNLRQLVIRGIPFTQDALKRLLGSRGIAMIGFDHTQARGLPELEFELAVYGRNWKEAEELFTKAVEETTRLRHGRRQQWENALSSLGAHYFEMGKVAECERIVQALCRTSAAADNDRDLMQLIALVWSKPNVEAAYKLAVKSSPRKSKGWFKTLMQLAGKLEGPHNPQKYKPASEWKRGREILLKAEKAANDHDLVEVHQALALNCFWLWELEAARRYSRMTIEESAKLGRRDFWEMRTILARILICEKNYKEALSECDKVLSNRKDLVESDLLTALSLKRDCLTALHRQKEANECEIELNKVKNGKSKAPPK
jgi:tetratricopeptide (TPR) repeat protein